MNAVILIQAHCDAWALLNHYKFDRVRSDGENIRACCKLHGGNNPTAFVMNPEGLWYCHTGGCGGGDIFTLVQRMESVDFYAAVRILAELFDVDISGVRITEKKQRHIGEIQRFIKTMKSMRPAQPTEAFSLAANVREVTRFRSFLPETLAHFHVGYVDRATLYRRSGEAYTLCRRLVFPVIFQGIQVGVALRRTHSRDYPKWSHQPAGLEFKNLLYNYDNVSGATRIAVCEGLTDVMAFYEIDVPAVATFGAGVSEAQYRLLLRSGADLIICYDGDDAGRRATQKALNLFQHKANLFTLPLEEGEDPESIGRETLKERYERSNPLWLTPMISSSSAKDFGKSTPAKIMTTETASVPRWNSSDAWPL